MLAHFVLTAAPWRHLWEWNLSQPNVKHILWVLRSDCAEKLFKLLLLLFFYPEGLCVILGCVIDSNLYTCSRNTFAFSRDEQKAAESCVKR